jgi:hypothetical protein
MKKIIKILHLAAIMLLLAGMVSSCGKEESLAFTEFSFNDHPCKWTNLNYDQKIIIINNYDDLAKYVICTDNDYPDIDFSKYTLLLASGGATNGISKIDISLQKTGNKYILHTIIHLDMTTVPDRWYVAILAPKLSNSTNIILDVKSI